MVSLTAFSLSQVIFAADKPYFITSCENFIQCSKEKIKTDYQFKPSLFLYFELIKSKYNNRDEIPLEECLRIRREKYVSSSKNEFKTTKSFISIFYNKFSNKIRYNKI